MGIMRPIRKTPDFNPRSPCGERLERAVAASTHISISIHALLAESDGCHRTRGVYLPISIHALLAESDHLPRFPGLQCCYFNPRSPCGERQLLALRWEDIDRFQSTLSLRRATSGMRYRIIHHIISIHALLAESDMARKVLPPNPFRISIHALLAESDVMTISMAIWSSTFQSTLSLRRATRLGRIAGPLGTDFNPRSPCGERPWHPLAWRPFPRNFNPRSPCGERPWIW